MSIPISACIMCRNEAEKIGRALDSLAWADEILLVDSNSTDDTADLARSHPTNPRILIHPWPGYSAQRQFMVAQCKNDWVFMLDADEEVSPQLARQLAAITPAHTTNAALFKMPRRNYIAKRYVRCWSPDFQKRLIHKDRINWDTTSQFDTWSAKPGFQQLKLAGPIEHNRLSPYDPRDFSDPTLMAERAQLLGDYLYSNGKRASLLQLLTRPALTFLKYYLLKGAFLDGRFGLAIAYKTTIGAALKYSVLYGRELAAAQPPPPEKPPQPS